MSRRIVSDIYNDFKDFCQYELQDSENPHLAPVSFNEVPPAGLASMIIPLVGIQSVNTRKFDRTLKKFRNGQSELHMTEGINGKPDYHIEIPLPRKSHQKKGHGKRGHKNGSTSIQSPSCTKLLFLVLLFVVILFAGIVTHNIPGF